MTCPFCKKQIKEIDFRDVKELKKYITGLGKIRARKRTGLCSYHQRKVSKAIKQARHLGLLSPIKK
jgi:small subunit ribosomal protein S18